MEPINSGEHFSPSSPWLTDTHAHTHAHTHTHTHNDGQERSLLPYLPRVVRTCASAVCASQKTQQRKIFKPVLGRELISGRNSQLWTSCVSQVETVNNVLFQSTFFFHSHNSRHVRCVQVMGRLVRTSDVYTVCKNLQVRNPYGQAFVLFFATSPRTRSKVCRALVALTTMVRTDRLCVQYRQRHHDCDLRVASGRGE